MNIYNFSNGFSRHQFSFPVRTGIIFCSCFSVSFYFSGNRTCSDIKHSYPRTPSDFYVIDPDGEGGEKPFKVFCDMADKDGVGVTVVSHDSENRTLWMDFRTPAVIRAMSRTREPRLFRDGYGWWVSRDGEKMKYWGGVGSIDYKCACGLKRTCANPEYGCNCDKLDQKWREDSGLLTNKSRLPVKQLRFGDTGSTKSDQGYHTLGKLKCLGLI